MTIKSWLAVRLVFAIAAGGLCVSPVRAVARSVGESLVYEMTHVTTAKTDLSSLPATIRARAEANQAKANGKALKTVLTLKVDKVDADGNAHVNVSYNQAMEGLSGPVATAFAATQRFQATLKADGRLLPASDPDMPMTMDSRGMYSAAEAQNIHGQQMQGYFATFNTFVTGLSKRAQIKTGDAWRLVEQDAYGQTHAYEFSVSAADPGSAASAPSVSMKGDFAGPSSTSKITATGHYDAARRLVTDFHEENAYSSTTPNGVSSSGVTTTDINLRS